MPLFEPFRAIRYSAAANIERNVAEPYDVLSEDDANLLRDRDDHNIVWIDLPEGGKDRYEMAGFRLDEWLREGILENDERDCFTIYRMSFTDSDNVHREVAGVVGALKVVDKKSDEILLHERITKKDEEDRLELMKATAANTSPVWGLTRAAGLTKVLGKPGIHLSSVVVDGVRHTIEKVEDPRRIRAISRLISKAQVVLADGHHRYTVSRTYRDLVRKELGKHTDAEFTLAFISEFSEDQLNIEAHNRVYDGISLKDLKRDLSGSFTFEEFTEQLDETTVKKIAATKRFVLVDSKGNALWLVPRPGAFMGVRDLPGARLEHALAGSFAKVSYVHGIDQTIKAAEDATAAILVSPVSFSEIAEAANKGKLMPPKSTYFTPKPLTGFVIRPTAKLPQ